MEWLNILSILVGWVLIIFAEFEEQVLKNMNDVKTILKNPPNRDKNEN